MGTFINLSNHPSARWSPEQKEAASALAGGEVEDIPFPEVAPEASTVGIEADADRLAGEIAAKRPGAVGVTGEWTLTVALVVRLQRAGIRCVSPSSRREVRELPGGDGATKKEVVFRFVGWRDYPDTGLRAG